MLCTAGTRQRWTKGLHTRHFSFHMTHVPTHTLCRTVEEARTVERGQGTNAKSEEEATC